MLVTWLTHHPNYCSYHKEEEWYLREVVIVTDCLPPEAGYRRASMHTAFR